MKKETRELIEEAGWTVNEFGTKVEIGCSTPAGEDFSFEVPATNLAEEVRRYADDFDYEEHVAMWLQAKKEGASGVPSLDDLVEDAHVLEDWLEELATRLENDPIELATFPDDDKDYCKWFKVDLRTVLEILESMDEKNNGEGVSLRRFIDNYVWDETDVIYRYAANNGKIIEEGVS